MDSSKAKLLYPVASGFWTKGWHHTWRKKQYDKIYDRVESIVSGSAALEVQSLGMNKSPLLRDHLHKCFGGAGDDVRAREEHYSDGMPSGKGQPGFPVGVNMEEKLRVLQGERISLWKMCKPSKRDEYEYGKKSKLVKIVLKGLRNTIYQESIDILLQEIKMKKNFDACLPVMNILTGALELPGAVEERTIVDDWDYRNYSDDWLPPWEALKSKLISVYKAKKFDQGSDVSTKHNDQSKKLPVMMVPGLGINPKVQCFACGEHGHRKGDASCRAGPNDWADCAPAKFKAKAKSGKFNVGLKRKGGHGVDGMKGKAGDGICYAFRDTGKCRFGPNCKFKHQQGTSVKKIKMTKGQKKGITVAAVKSITETIKKKAKERDGRELDDNDLADYISSLMTIQTIPRHCDEPITMNVSTLKASSLLDTEKFACWDSGAGTGISTDPNDFAWIDTSEKAVKSVHIRGPSVGTPLCGGRGPLIYRAILNGVPHGLVHPEGVLADSELKFRVASERIMGKRGLRFVGGDYNNGDQLECVRSKKVIPMETDDNILVLETCGKASELVDSPKLRAIVQDVKLGKRSPLVDLTEHLKNNSNEKKGNMKWASMSAGSFLAMVLLVGTIAMTQEPTCLVFNEAKVDDLSRARLWCRRFAYCNTALFGKMSAMPEYGDFPDLPSVNEDNLVGDLAKYVRKSYPKNDPAVSMNCPPWWRVYVDGYGGQDSLGGESYEGAVGGYLFVCVSTGSADCRFYASHTQFPVALHQFLVRVEAEHWRCHVIYADTFSVNLSEDVEEVCALFSCVMCPVSAGTPQEMAYAESMVRTIKRMSTAMLEGAPHLPRDSWALCDKYAVYLHDFLPQSTRNFHCPFYLRTGMVVNWSILSIHTMGAPLIYSPMDGPIHKRAAMNQEGNFMGIQWPAALVRRKSDGKIMSVSRKKIRVYESAYLAELDQRVNVNEDVEHALQEVKEDFVIEAKGLQNESMTSPLSSGETLPKPELSKNMVQSIKSLREHHFSVPGMRKEAEAETNLERSASVVNDKFGGEGAYVDDICNQQEFERLTNLIEEASASAVKGCSKPSVRSQVLAKLKSLQDLVSNQAMDKGRLKVGKRKKDGDVSMDNMVVGKRTKTLAHPVDTDSTTSSSEPPPVQLPSKKKVSELKPSKIREGDVVSLPSAAFDGVSPGSFSNDHPERCFGIVVKIGKQGLAKVRWLEGNEVQDVRISDLKKEVNRLNLTQIIVMIVEGEKVAFQAKDKNQFPKNFFELLVKSDWRRWVEAVKKELTGWDANDAVTVVDIKDVPAGAKVVPLGELYTIKRDGRYKFRQYLMGNLLREGVDFAETFSTTVSGSGICMFYSLATTCEKEVWGWDAVCGYLQAKEQYDVYAFLPSHHEYSNLEYEELGKLRQEFVKLVSQEGGEGLRKFAAKHRRDSRTNPKQVYKCNSSIYGGPGCGHEFEMLIHSVHTKTCGCTQTQPEPSIFVRIEVDKDDKVIGYLIAAAFVDDLRFFGTEPERKKYMSDVASKVKVTFEKPPVTEFVAIETYQCLDTKTSELKMPRYWAKAAGGYASFFPTGLKERRVPITTYDEKILEMVPTEDEVKAAKHLPYREILGVMSFPASCCKFEMKYSISVLGSRRGAWSSKHFDIVLKVFEYGVFTSNIGLMYSSGLDPHGQNILYGYADASLKLPRPYGCRICMMNGAAVLFKAKKQTLTAPSSCWAELTELFNLSTDMRGLRNLVSELGMYQEKPSLCYQDNESAIKIANNRGSLGPTSRAMDLRTLSTRNRIEDHEIRTEFKRTTKMIADMGTKALPENPFVVFRDVMNGYALVKAAYPNKKLSPLIYDGDVGEITVGLVAMQCKVKAMGGYFSPDDETL